MVDEILEASRMKAAPAGSMKMLSLNQISEALNNVKDISNIQLAKDLLGRVRILDDCWILNDDWSEYASFNGKRAHRLSYELFNGESIRKYFVCHSCDRKGCINPKHLFRGTASENKKDFRIKMAAYKRNRQAEMLYMRDRNGGSSYDENKEIKSWRDMV